jgi:predicted AAA+ superfamily ATPase
MVGRLYCHIRPTRCSSSYQYRRSSGFSGFLKLCSGRAAQEINLSKIGNDAGISHNTVRSWLSVLETSYIIQRLPSWHTNIRKQIVKTPKLHFFDSGLACYLLGIREPDQLFHHPLRGAIFESWVISEIFKVSVHSGIQPRIFHYRETRGIEIDLLIEQPEGMDVVEIKSGATISTDFFKNLECFSDRVKNTDKKHSLQKYVIYGGDNTQKRSKAQVLSWRDIHQLMS